MALETGTYISDLVATNPTSTDPKSAGDDHLRLVKSTVKATFPNISGAVTPTHTELNYVGGVTSAIQTQINTKGAIAGQAWTGTHTFPTQTAADNSTKAATTAYVEAATAAEAALRTSADNTLQGNITSEAATRLAADNTLQTNINAKADLASPALTGTPTAPTAANGTNNTQIATTAFAVQLAFAAALPGQINDGTPRNLQSQNGTAAWVPMRGRILYAQGG